MPPSVLRDVENVFAIGDLHGNYQGLIAILTFLEVIDAGGHWTGQQAHVVQLGDVLGRGGEPGKIYALLHRLEMEAAGQGGGVHFLLGNHEVLTLKGTLVYNTPAEFQDVADWAPATFGPIPVAEEPPAKYQQRLAMLGCDTFQRYLNPEGPLGVWLLQHPTAMVLGDTLFVHGGLNRHHGLTDLVTLNQQVKNEIEAAAQGDTTSKWLVKDGPQWNREYTVKWTSSRTQELNDVLDFHGCSRMVVGHTPTGTIAPLRTGEVLPLYEDRLWCADTGIGSAYGGHLSALALGQGKVQAVYPG